MHWYIRLFILCLATLVGLASNTNALSWEVYGNLSKNPEAKYILDKYVEGALAGITSANSYIEVKKNQKLFCAPEKIIIDLPIILSMVNQELKESPWNLMDPDAIPVEMVVLYALIHQLPCE